MRLGSVVTGGSRVLRTLGALTAIVLLTAATCGRPVSVESEGAAAVGPTTYQIEVENRTDDDLVVYQASVPRPIRLGLVRAGASERFFVTTREGAELVINARDAAGEAEPLERQVLLVEGEVVEVVLRR